MKATLIGITSIMVQLGEGVRPPHVGQNQTYVDALLRAGALPLLLPHVVDKTSLRVLFETLDGLLLSGGEDVDPARYGEKVHERCGRISPDRDEMELTLIQWACEEETPLLAICRGIQVLNVALGGSLYQDIEAQIPEADRHTGCPGSPRDRIAHQVEIAPETDLARLLGTTALPVNSRHHQAIKGLAPGVVVAAMARDGIVEAVELECHPFAIGVQWHPEDLAPSDARAQRLFDALVEACR